MSGLFTIYALLARPTVFNAYVGCSAGWFTDRDQAIHRQMIRFSELVRRNVGDAMSYRYETYEDYPHVPFLCLYDGLRFVTMGRPKK